MATYIMLVNYTDQGIRHIKESPGRLGDAKELAKSLGGSFMDIYLTLGVHDFVATLDLPDDAAAAKFALALGALGRVRTTTLKAFSEEEFKSLVAELP